MQISKNNKFPKKGSFLKKAGLFLLMLGVSGWSFAAGITLNLKDADIGAVAEMVSKETGKNFVIDPRVKGKVTIISSHSMGKDELYQVFLSVLDVHGFSAVPTGEITKIIPSANAKHTAGDEKENSSDGLDAFVTRVIQIQNVSGAQLVPILRPLVPPQGHLAAHPQTNTLIVSSQAANIARLMMIISRIDQPSSGEVEVIALQHASSTEVVRVLDSLLQKDKSGDPQASVPILVADERTNSILVGGDMSGRLRIRALITHLDTPTETVGNTHVLYLRYAKAKELVPVLTGVAESQSKEQQGKTAAPAKGGTFQIQADESTNALVITAAPDVYRSLRSVIKQLDIRRAQVLVEAVIAEVSSSRAAELGVQWVFDSTNSGGGPVGVINFGSSGASIMDIGSAAAAGNAALPNIQGTLLGAGRFSDTGLSFATLIRALDGDGATNVLSTPSIVTLDNKEAEIVVGQEVPFVTGSYSSTGSSGGSSVSNPFQTIKREKVGISLKVLPQINAGDSVKLDIEQKVDSIEATAVGAADIVTNTRSIKTSIMVDDGKMIVLGGLIKDDLVEGEQKVPLLGDIPLLGALFRHKSTTKIKRNLMVFLKPTILRDIEDSVKATESKYSLIRNKQLELSLKGVALMPDEVAPVLPEDPQAFQVPAPAPAPQPQPMDETEEKVDELESGIFTDE